MLDLEKYKNAPRSNETVWLVYTKQQSKVDDLIYELLAAIRKQSLDNLTKEKDLVRKGKDEQVIRFIDREFRNAQRFINNAGSRELKNQKYEKEFRKKVQDYLDQNFQSRSQEGQRVQQTQIQQNILPNSQNN